MSLSNSRIAPSVAMLSAAIVAVAVLELSSFHLLAAAQNDKPAALLWPGLLTQPRILAAAQEKPAERAPEKTSEKTPGEARTWQGQVVERGTFTPIGGVDVVITLSAEEVKAKNEPEYRRQVTCTTKDDGTYEFTVTAEEAARPHLYIEASITTKDHPEYYGGYGYGLILKNEKLGVAPFFKRLILWPGRTIEGIVKTPAGQPAAGVRVVAYISPTPLKPNPWARFPSTKTDAEGRFKLIVHEKQRSVLWILPQDYAPEVHNVTNMQHDLGTFTLTPGERLTGKLRDSDGKPVGGVYVEASVVRQNPQAPNPLVPHHVANQIRRTTLTAADGSFEFRPLPPARKYEIQPTESSWDPSTSDKERNGGGHNEVKKPLPAVFMSQTVVLKKGGTAVEFQAVPHVMLEAQRLNSRGEKREGRTIHLIGSLGNETWMTSAESSPTGAYRVLVPKGLSGASLSLIYDPDSAFQYRLKPDAPLQYGRHFQLGTINQDLEDVEIIHYAAPTIVISVTNKDGTPIDDLLPSVDYTDPEYDGRRDKLYHRGKSGESQTDVPFDDLGGGKIRTIQLVPDREVNVTVRAEGFKPESRKITLPEGRTEELKFVLEPK